MSGRRHISATLTDANGRWIPIDGDQLGRLRVLSGSFDGSRSAALRWSGKLSVLNSEPPGGWGRYMIRIRVVITEEDGTWASHDHGLYIPSTDVAARPGQPVNLELYSPLLRLQDYATPNIVSLAKGVPILPAAWLYATEAGVMSTIGLDAPDRMALTLRENKMWPPGTAHLALVNDLLATAGWMAAEADPSTGWISAQPWVPPSRRPVVHTFEAGEAAIHDAGWQVEQDLFDVPNRMICMTSGGAQEALVAVADNTDPASPTSIPSRGGRVKAATEQHEAASQAALQAIANRRINEASQAVRTIPLKHLWTPGVTLGAVVRVNLEGINELAVVEKQRIDADGTELVESTVRVVVS
ncbi:MAG: hypothetical protein Q4G35_03225 [Propionibacteriaceae bacterium]|nr:hypothetical protein [Propionibacteriaceae bacterium]